MSTQKSYENVPSADEQMSKIGYNHTIEYYATIKSNRGLPRWLRQWRTCLQCRRPGNKFTTCCVADKHWDILLRERGPIQMATQHMIPFLWNAPNGQSVETQGRLVGAKGWGGRTGSHSCMRPFGSEWRKFPWNWTWGRLRNVAKPLKIQLGTVKFMLYNYVSIRLLFF